MSKKGVWMSKHFACFCPISLALTQKPSGGGLLCPERREGEVSAHVWGAAKLVLSGSEHLSIFIKKRGGNSVKMMEVFFRAMMLAFI